MQGKFDPGSVDGGGSGQTFVIYNWSTAGVWYSQDGTPGSFEPYGGNGLIAWQQGQADTSFQAQFFAPGQYLLEVSCTATVYSQTTGAVVGTFTQTCYIGGSADDIDQSGGGSMGHARKAAKLKAHAAVAHAGGGGTGHQVAPVTVTFNPNSLIKLGLGAPRGYKTTITATISPADQASTVFFSATNGEVSVANSSTPDASGNVTVYITAVSGTPAGSGSSDCNVIATSGPSKAQPLATVPVLVLQPTYADETPSYAEGIPVNEVFTSVASGGDAIPGDWSTAPVPTGYVDFLTHVSANITITIKDQFGSPLDSMYNGHLVVKESFIGDAQRQGSAITYPDGQLTNGQILDEVGAVAGPPPVSLKTKHLDVLEEHWLAKVPTFPSNKPLYDNGFAINQQGMPGQQLRLKQTLTVYGYNLVPSNTDVYNTVWLRTIGFPGDNISTGPIEIVGEEPDRP